MEVKRQESYCYKGAYDYDFILENMKLRFFYGGNNDIYLSIQPLDEDTEVEHVYVRFTKDNPEVYACFYELFNSLLTGDVYKDDEENDIELLEFEKDFNNFFIRSAKEKNDDARKYSRWNEFAQDSVITMMSDNCEEDYANLLKIYLDDEDLVFEFTKKNPCDIFLTFEISTSGSRYTPYEKVFMELYNNLQKIEFGSPNVSHHSLRKKV